MSENTDKNRARDHRIVRHVKALQKALGDDDAYRIALNDIRDDNVLSDEQRGAIYKTLAQQSLLWYIEASTGKAVDVEGLTQKLHAARSQQS